MKVSPESVSELLRVATVDASVIFSLKDVVEVLRSVGDVLPLLLMISTPSGNMDKSKVASSEMLMLRKFRLPRNACLPILVTFSPMTALVN